LSGYTVSAFIRQEVSTMLALQVAVKYAGTGGPCGAMFRPLQIISHLTLSQASSMHGAACLLLDLLLTFGVLDGSGLSAGYWGRSVPPCHKERHHTPGGVVYLGRRQSLVLLS
jgi:hypothetical protein